MNSPEQKPIEADVSEEPSRSTQPPEHDVVMPSGKLSLWQRIKGFFLRFFYRIRQALSFRIAAGDFTANASSDFEDGRNDSHTPSPSASGPSLSPHMEQKSDIEHKPNGPGPAGSDVKPTVDEPELASSTGLSLDGLTYERRSPHMVRVRHPDGREELCPPHQVPNKVIVIGTVSVQQFAKEHDLEFAAPSEHNFIQNNDTAPTVPDTPAPANSSEPTEIELTPDVISKPYRDEDTEKLIFRIPGKVLGLEEEVRIGLKPGEDDKFLELIESNQLHSFSVSTEGIRESGYLQLNSFKLLDNPNPIQWRSYIEKTLLTDKQSPEKSIDPSPDTPATQPQTLDDVLEKHRDDIEQVGVSVKEDPKRGGVLVSAVWGENIPEQAREGVLDTILEVAKAQKGIRELAVVSESELSENHAGIFIDENGSLVAMVHYSKEAIDTQDGLRFFEEDIKDFTKATKQFRDLEIARALSDLSLDKAKAPIDTPAPTSGEVEMSI